MNQDSKNKNENISAIILSAGRSGRFGRPKAFLPFDETKSFLQEILLEYYNAGINKIVLVINPDLMRDVQTIIEALPSDMKINILINPHPETGRFDSIRIAVNEIESMKYSFIQNIDNPFTSSDLINQMIDKATEGDYVIPYYFGEKGHPVLISNKIIKYILQMKSSVGNLRDVLNEFKPVGLLTGDPYILANINTPEEYSRYLNYENVNH